MNALRGLWRKVRSLFGDPVARDGIAATAAAVQAAVVAQAEQVRSAVTADADRTRTAVTYHAEQGQLRTSEEAAATRQHVGLQAEQVRVRVTEAAENTKALVAEQADQVRLRMTEESDVTRGRLLERLDALERRLEHVPADLGLDRWRINELEGLLRYVRRRDYDAAIAAGTLAVPHLHTGHPVAVYSDDTKHPRGSKQDNSVCLRFNRKLQGVFPGRRLNVLDLGCAGGGLVRSFLDAGHLAVGLDGSDFPLVNQSGEWATIPRHLFTCDVTQPFRLTDTATGTPLAFDAITAWELLEHIPEDRLPGLLANLDAHLAADGILTFSIATFVDHDPVTGALYHVSVHPREWWEEKFAAAGFVPDPAAPFGPYDWVRGSGHCRGDWTEESGLGFHLALRRRSFRSSQA